MPRYHPDDEILSSYVAGLLSEMQSVPIATHLTLCPTCRDVCDGFDELGGVLLSQAVDEPVHSSTLDNVLDRLESPDVAPQVQSELADDETRKLIPQPIRDRLPGPFKKMIWGKLGRHIQYIDLAVNESGVKARLLRLPAGLRLPAHTHSGNEMTVVLSGGFSDQFGHYLRGDFATRDETEKHRPVVDEGEDCLCFTVTDAPLRLTGPIGFLFNRLINW